jgi:hypothetical protein
MDQTPLSQEAWPTVSLQTPSHETTDARNFLRLSMWIGRMFGILEKFVRIIATLTNPIIRQTIRRADRAVPALWAGRGDSPVPSWDAS